MTAICKYSFLQTGRGNRASDGDRDVGLATWGGTDDGACC